LVDAIAASRAALYRALPTFKTFGKGWLARIERTRQAALIMAAA
jgi:lysozyme family protein